MKALISVFALLAFLAATALPAVSPARAQAQGSTAPSKTTVAKPNTAKTNAAKTKTAKTTAKKPKTAAAKTAKPKTAAKTKKATPAAPKG